MVCTSEALFQLFNISQNIDMCQFNCLTQKHCELFDVKKTTLNYNITWDYDNYTDSNAASVQPPTTQCGDRFDAINNNDTYTY